MEHFSQKSLRCLLSYVTDFHQLDNDLFCFSPDRRESRLNQIQQLRLVQILCDYFNEKESEARNQQYAYFEAIFCGREGETALHDTRISVLINLCSLAVQYPCYSVLNHTSQWLHKIGSGKSYAQKFVSKLVEHYILVSNDSDLPNDLFPLAEEVPEFASYFIAYSVMKESLRLPLFNVLNHWLSGRRGNLILEYIKETPAITQHFATVTFSYMVVFDCISGGAYKNPLHGFTAMLYADWNILPALDIRLALEMLSKDAEYSAFDTETLRYHIHLAKLARVISEKVLVVFFTRSESSASFRALKDDLLTA
ncbi:unnamed protein product [Gongylonema pulchrum]|uniref:Uncharacterized protein n=1 Tax=Gongylonema pulchrum TaxID=637853 RepID=A0A183EIR4_9BILA|nr:unnamed protein product [Gongylonema pulchrum]